MAATPQYGGMFFVGSSGKTYSVDIYVSDVNGALVNFDGGAGAGASSPAYWTAPEDCVLRDYSQVTGTADTEKLRITKNGLPTPNILRYGVHLTSLNERPKLQIGFKEGTMVGAFQISD